MDSGPLRNADLLKFFRMGLQICQDTPTNSYSHGIWMSREEKSKSLRGLPHHVMIHDNYLFSERGHLQICESSSGIRLFWEM